MDITQKIAALASRAKEQIDHIVNEEATKNAMVMPFIQSLGYDVFNPTEVLPEFTADVGLKKGEKVDYAIKNEGVLSILIECKPRTTDLANAQFSQLYRYFNCTEAKFAILTNGIEYRFYSDLDDANKLDTRPFFTFRLTDYNERDIEELKKFAKPVFNVDTILSTANRLKYTNLAKASFSKLMKEPPRDFIKFIAQDFFDGRMTQQVLDEFTPIIRDAMAQHIKEQVSQRLKLALATTSGEESSTVVAQPGQDNTEVALKPEDEIVTTQEEIDGYNMVRAIVASAVAPERVYMRDAKSYCAILLDDNNRKPICRLHFNSKTLKRLEIRQDDQQVKHDLATLTDIFSHSEALLAAVKSYE
ncbi:type I restriction enzyme HsdR N-terminal domain-containing protein [Halomonas sp. ISL-60]|uniref:type I restriction endonuclease n=1 Tax=Halomonas sp. ISL-56 TaxID=2819149 RepID=UPI001BEB6FB3|nr:type I restriction endonuclease [Halomonas sp. ISL-56]MBT2771856.1 type I restriction enzyme HsdR N-terminal domain-containing protein [Halomonas sp. ISL-60]MBT2800179.1 type I restriction enzyme HsdR N-terminal domain-containing protein [Halomonas sp. ISL-56]